MSAAEIFGLGLRHKHHQYVLQNNPKVDFFEVHTENFIAEGGYALDLLSQISSKYPLSFHCIGLSLGSVSGLDLKHIKNVKKLLDRFKPLLFSDHLSWSNSPQKGISNDLLPVPYTKEALRIFCDNVVKVQDFFGCQILIENPSSYLEYNSSTLEEIDFINEIAHRSNCKILLDINNVFVSSKNFNFDAKDYLQQIDSSRVGEIHLAGHSVYEYGKEQIHIDTHSTHICDEVLQLYKNFVISSKIKVPTLVEWDEEIPEFSVLFSEMKKVRALI
jgi:uncharacterized protein (UPF0276 family)